MPDPSDFPDEPFCYLTTIGRRSGRLHTIEIWFAVDDGALYLMSGGSHRFDESRQSDWVRNLIANPSVSVRIREHEWDARARVVEPDTEEDARVRPMLRDKYADTEDDLVSWACAALPVAIEGFVPRTSG